MSLDRVGVRYPDPIEGDEERYNYAVPHPSGIEYHERVWRERNRVHQFSVMLVIDDTGATEDPTQLTRVDTWHSSVHKHQFYRSEKPQVKTIIKELYGGDRLEESKKAVHDHYKRFNMELTCKATDYLECWEDDLG